MPTDDRTPLTEPLLEDLLEPSMTPIDICRAHGLEGVVISCLNAKTPPSNTTGGCSNEVRLSSVRVLEKVCTATHLG